MQEQTNFESQKEIDAQNEYTALRRELKINRMFSAAVCVLMLCLIIGGGVLWSRFESYAKAAAPLMEQLSQVDYEQVNTAIEKLETTLGAVDWEQLSQQLEAVDVEALNKAIEGLDTKALTEALENLNEAVSGFKNFTGKLFGK